jgi:ATP/maltotriose-dependent transcriptional regulator MalT
MNGINTTGPTDFAGAVTAGLKAGEAGPAGGGRRRPSVSAHCAGRPAGQHRRGPAGHPGRAAHRRFGPPGSRSQADSEPGQRLAASLRIFWMASGHAAEGADALQALLGVPAAQQATLPRARALAAATHLLQQKGGYAIAGNYCDAALAIARAAGDDYLVAGLLHIRAWLLVRQGQPGAALRLIEQGLGLAHRLGEPHLTARLLPARAYAANVEADPAGADRDNAEAALRISRQAGDQLQARTMLNNLSDHELGTGDPDAARRLLAEALDITGALNARHSAVIGTFNLGLAEYLPAWSARLHGAADQALADLGHVLQRLETPLASLDRQRLRAAMATGAFDAEYAQGRSLDLVRAAHQALQGLQAGREASSADMLASEPDAALSDEAVPALTPRELDVLKLVAEGLSNPDIAQQLFLSGHTVHRHLANILRKLNLSSRAAAAAWGVRTGLV